MKYTGEDRRSNGGTVPVSRTRWGTVERHDVPDVPEHLASPPPRTWTGLTPEEEVELAAEIGIPSFTWTTKPVWGRWLSNQFGDGRAQRNARNNLERLARAYENTATAMRNEVERNVEDARDGAADWQDELRRYDQNAADFRRVIRDEIVDDNARRVGEDARTGVLSLDRYDRARNWLSAHHGEPASGAEFRTYRGFLNNPMDRLALLASGSAPVNARGEMRGPISWDSFLDEYNKRVPNPHSEWGFRQQGFIDALDAVAPDATADLYTKAYKQALLNAYAPTGVNQNSGFDQLHDDITKFRQGPWSELENAWKADRAVFNDVIHKPGVLGTDLLGRTVFTPEFLREWVQNPNNSAHILGLSASSMDGVNIDDVVNRRFLEALDRGDFPVRPAPPLNAGVQNMDTYSRSVDLPRNLSNESLPNNARDARTAPQMDAEARRLRDTLSKPGRIDVTTGSPAVDVPKTPGLKALRLAGNVAAGAGDVLTLGLLTDALWHSAGGGEDMTLGVTKDAPNIYPQVDADYEAKKH